MPAVATGPPPPACTLSSGRPTAQPRRLASLDAARGMAIGAMLIMNHPGSWEHTYASLQHAEWNGWTITDLVFPIFLLVVGVSMTLSFGKQLDQGRARGRVLARAGRRAAVLFLLGLMLAGFPWWDVDVAAVRIPGVLQRIALAFLLATPMLLWLGVRAQAAVTAALLLAYWAIMRWVPVPGIGAGVWEPGMDIGAYLDRAVLGESHLWPGRSWDPLGLLGTLPATANVMIGALAGQWLRAERAHDRVVAGLVGGGALAIGAGAFWGSWFPINKNLWTSSYAVFAAGWGLLLLAACYWSLEVRAHRAWARPFMVLGGNAILIYFLASLADMVAWRIPLGPGSLRTTTHQLLFASWLSPVNASLAFAVVHLGLWIGLAWVLDRRGVRIRV